MKLEQSTWDARKEKLLQEGMDLSAQDIKRYWGFKVWDLFSRFPELHPLWKEREPFRRSGKMRGNKNGVRPPCRVIPKKDLEKDIASGCRKYELMEKYKMGERLLHRNLEFHDLKDAMSSTQNLPHRMIEDFDLLKRLEVFRPGLNELISNSKTKPLDTFKKIRGVQKELLFSILYLKELGSRMARRHGIEGVSFSLNVAEVYAETILDDLGVKYQRAFPILYRGRRFVFDFFLPSKGILLEIDGSIHRRGPGIVETRKKDLLRAKAAKAKGYKLKSISHFTRKTLYTLDEEIKNAVL